MNDLINLLQTLTLLVGLLCSIMVLLLIVYNLGRFATAFEKLIQAIDRIGEATGCCETPKAVGPPEPPPNQDIQENAAPKIKRYPCHRCDAKLPEEPINGVIKDGVSILVFKCRRCGKETEIDPEKSVPVTENK